MISTTRWRLVYFIHRIQTVIIPYLGRELVWASTHRKTWLFIQAGVFWNFCAKFGHRNRPAVLITDEVFPLPKLLWRRAYLESPWITVSPYLPAEDLRILNPPGLKNPSLPWLSYVKSYYPNHIRVDFLPLLHRILFSSTAMFPMPLIQNNITVIDEAG